MTLAVVIVWAHHPVSLFPSSCCCILHCHPPSSCHPVVPTAQETLFDVSWTFFLFAFPSLCGFPLIPLLFCLPVVSSHLDVALSFHLVWWLHCHCFAILQLYPFPPCKQFLAAVEPGAGWWMPSLHLHHCFVPLHHFHCPLPSYHTVKPAGYEFQLFKCWNVNFLT